MNRLNLLMLWAMVALVPVAAAQPAKTHRIGILLVGTPTPQWAHLPEELRRLGYVEGQNLIVERRYPETREQLAAAAGELVAREVDLIVTGGVAAALAAKRATATIPIVFSLGADPVQRGLVASDARPGGNATGFVEGLFPDKKLELLKVAVPSIVRVACPCRGQSQPLILDSARRLGLELQDLDALALQHLEMQRPEDFAGFVAAARRAGTHAILMPNLQGYGRYLPHVGALATQHGLPAIGFGRTFVESGGLLSYGPKPGEGQRRVAAMVDKILRGTKPADVPVERQQGFELLVNMTTAAALGLTVPPSLISRADEVIR